MTEYWVSQGNKWCEFCRIYIANNASSIRSHELGQRHKDNVGKKVAQIHKDSANKEKEAERTKKELDYIESKAVKSYLNDVVTGSSAIANPTLTSSKINDAVGTRTAHTYSGKSTVAQPSNPDEAKVEWFKDAASGYQYNPATGHYFDPKSGFYYSDVLGQWTTEEEAVKAAKMSKTSGGVKKTPITGKALFSGASKPAQSQAPLPAVKGRPSSFAVAPKNNSSNTGKRKRYSAEEAKAQAEREAARKRVQEREKGSLGLYQAY